jgi:YopX protein
MINKRQIKLRAIHENGKWREWDAEDAIEDRCYYLAGRAEGTEIQQFTGILDKKDCEIWEGDFVSSSNLVWLIDDFNEFIYDVLYAEHHSDNTGFSRKNLEVIGNIYTHPELLNKV